MLDWSQCSAVERAAGKVSGEWLFKGTRVSVRALFENLEDGARVDDFLEWFPGVTREQVELVLRHAIPGISILAVVLPHRSPLSLAGAPTCFRQGTLSSRASVSRCCSAPARSTALVCAFILSYASFVPE